MAILEIQMTKKFAFVFGKGNRVDLVSGYCEIKSNTFLIDTLNIVNNCLVEIEEAYCKKERERN